MRDQTTNVKRLHVVQSLHYLRYPYLVRRKTKIAEQTKTDQHQYSILELEQRGA